MLGSREVLPNDCGDGAFSPLLYIAAFEAYGCSHVRSSLKCAIQSPTVDEGAVSQGGVGGRRLRGSMTGDGDCLPSEAGGEVAIVQNAM